MVYIILNYHLFHAMMFLTVVKLGHSEHLSFLCTFSLATKE